MARRSLLAHVIAASAVALVLAPVMHSFLVPMAGQTRSAGKGTAAPLSRSLRTPLTQMDAVEGLSEGSSPVLLAGGAVALLGLAAVAFSLNSGDETPASSPPPAPAKPAEPEPVAAQAPAEEPTPPVLEEPSPEVAVAEEAPAEEPVPEEPSAEPAEPAEAPAPAPEPVAETPVASESTEETVMWKGKQAVVRYRGSVKFGPGEWVGLELEEGGMHNGTVLGVKYFECPAGTGVFCLASEVAEKAPEPEPTPEPAPAPEAEPAPAPEPEPAAVSTPAEEPAAPAAPAPPPAAPVEPVTVGSEVTWNGQPAVVRFMGTVRFAAGDWVGLELKEGKGMHDGSLFGVSYFECAPGMGVFSQASQLATTPAPPPPAPAAPAAPAPAELAAPAAPPAPAEPLKMEVGAKVLWREKPGTVRYVGSAKFAQGEWVGVELDGPGGMHDGKVMGVSYFQCPAGRGVFCQASQLKVTEAA